MNFLRNCFINGINSVQPQNLIPRWIKREKEALVIGEKRYPLKNVFIVGFGKAVAGMVKPILDVLESPTSLFQEGIISVPHGYLNQVGDSDKLFSHPQIKFVEGARSNLPDEDSHLAAQRIMSLVSSLTKEDLLFVLISGGGSALLPMPIPPLNLNDKIKIIQSLSLSGASICEINSVRKMVSATKGGKLAQQSEAQVISFILSDIIGNPLSSIASGPTVINEDDLETPLKIMRKYNVTMNEDFKRAVRNMPINQTPEAFGHVYNVLIGDNSTALRSMHEHLQKLNTFKCIPIIMTSSLSGEASAVGVLIARLMFSILLSISDCSTGDHSWKSCLRNLYIPSLVEHDVSLSISRLRLSKESSICLLFGGETTVRVVGDGTGGRNQEMVLSASLELDKLSDANDAMGEIWFLSGGTDGIDGPTEAAGAITYWSKSEQGKRSQAREAREQGLIPDNFLARNASHEYFTSLNEGEYLLKTGHTGTNVMDVQIACISRRH